MKTYTETKLEAHMEKRLNASGFRSLHFDTFDRDLCLIPSEVLSFIKESQPKAYQKLSKYYGADTDQKLLTRITEEIGSGPAYAKRKKKKKDRGLINVLRNGIKDRGVHFDLCYFQPKSGLNPDHAQRYRQNRFVLVRQLHFSPQNQQSIDVVLFLNGLPLLTVELKNHYTSQTVIDAQKQYQDRDHKEKIFHFKRCLVHFAVDNDQVFMTTHLRKKIKWFPYNKGIQNPIYDDGHRVHYFWDEILQPESLLDIIENFVVIVEETDVAYDSVQGKVVEKKFDVQIFPRYHQLDAIREIRKEVVAKGVGRNFLIQHTTGAGKSYEIGWLSHILASLYPDMEATDRIFDSIIVLTDRRVLDKQLQNTITRLEKTKGVTNSVDKTSKQLKEYLEKGKDIIITTIQKFPVISNAIAELGDRKFAIVIDEVHSSQSGDTAKHVKKALTKGQEIEIEEEYDDLPKELMEDIKARGKQKNISYFGFTGTPKGKTLELFGEKEGKGKNATFRPFHSYTMRQSIYEGFTLDVLAHYMTYKRFFTLSKKLEEDPEVDKKKAARQLISYVDIQPETIALKVRTILDHFLAKPAKALNGRARAMVVTRSRLHCVKFTLEMKKQMKERGLNFSCLCGFSGKVKDDETGKEYTEIQLNGLDKGVSIPYALKDPQYRFLIVANKFQTGFDEPLLYAMYVDKKLSGLQCVQTLSRLNRSKTGKDKALVLDFVNEWDDIQRAFQPYYQTTYQDGETDPNRLYDLQREIEEFNLYTVHELEELVRIFYNPNIPDEKLMPIIERSVDRFKKIEEKEDQDTFKGNVQSYLRLYSYIAQLDNFTDPDLEKLYIYLKYLNKKLPREQRENYDDLLNAVDLTSFRVAKKWSGDIPLEYEDGAIQPMEAREGGGMPEPDTGPLSEIIKIINELFGEENAKEYEDHIENVMDRAMDSTDIKAQFQADNTEANRYKSFQEVMDQIYLSYVNTDFDFYKKVTTGEYKDVIMNFMYQELKRRFDRGGIG
ncbi:MAG: DEAD/DEAH box helicase family protein [Bacteroidota bacterium]